MNIILASQSPRRKELLAGLDIPFSTKVIPGLEESFPASLRGADIPLYLARQKAEAYKLNDDDLLITADTIVWFNDKVYGKPHSVEEAKDMLRTLSGQTHEVITGVCCKSNTQTESFAATTLVSFAKLSEEEIDYYINKYHPLDKAGSYGIQEWIGYIAVERIEGSYFNVMGLPIQRLYSVLKSFGI